MYPTGIFFLLSSLCLGYSNAQFVAFTTTNELYVAVDDYLTNSTSNATLSAIKYGYPMNTWDVSRITNFTRIFDPDRGAPFDGSGCGSVQSTFNENISSWNVANAVTMVEMFACTKFNRDISLWNTANVKTMSGMFMFATGMLFTMRIAIHSN
jgi:surface protein